MVSRSPPQEAASGTSDAGSASPKKLEEKLAEIEALYKKEKRKHAARMQTSQKALSLVQTAVAQAGKSPAPSAPPRLFPTGKGGPANPLSLLARATKAMAPAPKLELRRLPCHAEGLQTLQALETAQPLLVV